MKTSRQNHHARAIPVRGAPRSRTSPRLRAPITGFLLSLLVALSPDLTLAPINAGEPHIAGTQPIDRSDLVIPRRTWPRETAPRVSAPVAPQPAAPTVEEWNFFAALEAARAYGGAYGVTFAAVRDGEVVWSGAAGRYRDGATGLNGADSLVIGSVTKTYVSATILQLVEEGRLTLDERVAARVPGVGLDRRITVRMLLDHTSGLHEFFFYRRIDLALLGDRDAAWSAERSLRYVG